MKKLSTLWSLALVVLALGFSQKADAQTWIVAGSPAAAFNGEEWNPEATVNQMTLENGIYKFESNNVLLPNSDIKFKVTNGSWSEAYPSQDYVIEGQGAGYYNILITFNQDTKEVTGTATKTQGVDMEDKYVVAGSSTELFGTSWDKTNESNLMEKQDDGSYVLVKENVQLSAGNIEYKFVKNESDWFPANNRSFNISNAGSYNVKFVFYPSLNDGEEIVEAIEVKPLVISTLSLTGELTGGWAETDEQGTWVSGFVEMEDKGDGIWTYTVDAFEAEVKEYSYKVAANHNWSEYTLPAGSDNYIWNCEEAGFYTLEFTADTNNHTVSLVARKRENEPNAIATVEVETQNTVYYNLQGQRVAAPNKGVYICNGRKVILK